MAGRAAKSESNLKREDQRASLFTRVLDDAPVGLAILDTDRRMLFANRALDGMLERPAIAALGRRVEAFIFEGDRAAFTDRLNWLVEAGDGEQVRLECRITRPDGSTIWTLLCMSQLGGNHPGEPVRLVLQCIDIAKQKTAEAALAESESRWNFALEAAGQGVWDYNADRGTFYSHFWRRMRGMTDDEVVDASHHAWFGRMHPDDVARIAATVDQQLHGADGYDTMEYRERHRDGHYLWIRSRGRPVAWDAAGNPVRAVGTDSDITRLKLAEAALADEKERLRVTLQSIGDGVISTDAAGVISFMNPVAAAMTGWTETEAIGRPLAEIFATGTAGVVEAWLARGEPTRLPDETILLSRAARYGVAGTISPVRTADRSIIGAVLVFKDVTEAREQQRRIAHSASHDVLTGLSNRAALSLALDEARRQVATERRQHTLCFIDLDRFKLVNDHAGHAAGDALLQWVARVIEENCRADDLAVRLGGDEFVLLLADCTPADAKSVADHLVTAIALIDFEWRGEHYQIGASAGVAAIGGAPDSDPLGDADAACYRSKSTGRGRVSLA